MPSSPGSKPLSSVSVSLCLKLKAQVRVQLFWSSVVL